MSKLQKFKSAAKPMSKQEEIQKVELAMESRAAKTTFKKIPVDDIVFNQANDYNVHDVDESIQVLADDIYRNSLLHNIVVNKTDDSDKYTLISGERRVKAYKLLKADREKNKEGDYNLIQARIYYDLSPRQSLLMLDAANLQTRGSIGPEPLFRKALNRYIENLKAEFDISEGAALSIAKNITSASDKTVSNSRLINTRFVPELVSLIDNGILSKKWALAFLDFSQDEQKAVVEILNGTNNLPYEDEHARERAIRENTRKLVELSDEDKSRRGELLAKMLSIIKAEPVAHKNVYVSEYMRSKCLQPNFVRNILSARDNARKINSKRKLEALVAYETADERVGESAIQSLRDTISEMTALLYKVENLVDCTVQLKSGMNREGISLNKTELARLKAERKRLLNE